MNSMFRLESVPKIRPYVYANNKNQENLTTQADLAPGISGKECSDLMSTMAGSSCFHMSLNCAVPHAMFMATDPLAH